MIRRIYFVFCLGFLMLLAACSCTDTALMGISHPDLRLKAIDTLMWQQPNSAFSQLQTFAESSAMDSLDVFNGHYFHLLLSELLYKNDYAQTNRNELLQTVGYYDSLMVEEGHRVHLNLAFLDARAHYMNGVGYYEMDSVVPACKEYLKALEIMEDHFDEKNLMDHKAKFMALTNTHLVWLFSDMYLHEQALFFGKQALDYYNRYNCEPWHVAWVLDEIGMQYNMLDHYDTAYFYYNKGLRILSDTNNLSYRDITTHLAFLSYTRGDSLELVLQQLYNAMNQAESEKEYVSRCMTTASVLFQEERYDSALVLLNLVYTQSTHLGSRKQAAEWLVEICDLNGMDSSKAQYTDFLVPFATMEENSSSVKSRLTEMYNAYGLERQERLHQKAVRLRMIQTTIVVGGLFLIVLAVAFLYYFNKTRKKQLELQIKEERHAHEIQQKALSGKLKKRNEALLNSLKQKDISAIENTNDKHGSTKDYASFVEEPICRYILDTVEEQKFKSKMSFVVYKAHALQKNQLQALRLAADEKMDGFTNRIRKYYPNLNDDDVTYCCFYLLGLSEADISALMQKAYPTVCERKRKIKRILGDDGNVSFILQDL